jgi:hypothetical protein
MWTHKAPTINYEAFSKLGCPVLHRENCRLWHLEGVACAGFLLVGFQQVECSAKWTAWCVAFNAKASLGFAYQAVPLRDLLKRGHQLNQ